MTVLKRRRTHTQKVDLEGTGLDFNRYRGISLLLMSAQGWKLMAARTIKIPNRLITSKNVQVRWCLKVLIHKKSSDET